MYNYYTFIKNNMLYNIFCSFRLLNNSVRFYLNTFVECNKIIWSKHIDILTNEQ